MASPSSNLLSNSPFPNHDERLPSHLLERFYRNKILKSPNAEMMCVSKIGNENVRIQTRPDVQDAIPRSQLKFTIEPEDLILAQDPKNPSQYFLGKVISIEPNGEINLDLRDTKGNVVPYFIPLEKTNSVFMERIIPVLDDPAKLLENVPTRQISSSEFRVEWNVPLTVYCLKG